MNVSLTPELERLVNDKVSTGLYTSASEVIREALRLLRERDEARNLALEELRREVGKGVEQLDAGRSAVLDVQRTKNEARRRSRGA